MLFRTIDTKSFFKRSLAVYIVGLVVMLVLLSSMTYFLISNASHQNILKNHELTRDRDIRFFLNSLLMEEVNRLGTLSRTFTEREDMVVAIAVSAPGDEFLGSTRTLVDNLSSEFNLDIFELTDPGGHIIYKAHQQGTEKQTDAVSHDNEPATPPPPSIRVSTHENIHALYSTMPVMLGSEYIGRIRIGTLLDDEFAAKLSRATDSEVTLADSTGIFASSLSMDARTVFDPALSIAALKDNRHLRARIGDTSRVMTYRPMTLAGENITLAVEFDTADLKSLYEKTRRHYMQGLGASIAISLIVGIGLSIYLIAPLIRITRRAEETAMTFAGDKIDHRSGNEVHRLVTSFDIMVDTLTSHITERRLAQEALLESERKYRSLVESTEDSIYLVDRELRYLFVNKVHLRRLGIEGIEYQGRPFRTLHSEEETQWFAERIKEVCDCGESRNFEHRSIRDDRVYLLTLSPVLNDEGEVEAVTAISKNITHMKRLEQELKSLSLTDELTGLYNRRGFITMATQHFKIAGRLKNKTYLLYADLDNLKRLNDSLGHSAGDTLLVDTAETLRETFRDSDIIGRLGGDEFAVLILDSSTSSVEGLLERLQQRLDEINTKRREVYYISMSVGIVEYDPNVPMSVEEMLNRADALMYEDKRLKKQS